MRNEKTVNIVIPTYNRKKILRNCLRCLSVQSYNNYKIIVVDDGSQDGTSIMISEEFPDIKVIKGNGNLWWTGSVNKGIIDVLNNSYRDDFILIMNDDVEVEKNFIKKMVCSYNDKNLIGALEVDIQNPELIINGGIKIDWYSAKYYILNRGKNISMFKKDKLVEVSTLTGRGTLIPVEVFMEVGLYNEKHFKQCGDTEFPVRAKKNGYNLFVNYDAKVKSHVDKTSNINSSRYYNIFDIKDYLFDIKSNMRLKYRYYFALDTSKNFIQFISYLISDFFRIIHHFLKKVKLL